MVLHIVRHGETESNRNGLMLGWWDAPLTEKGRAQAAAAGQALIAEDIDVAYTSDLGRASQTARLLLDEQPDKIELIEDERLREFSFGGYEGRSEEDMAAVYLELGLSFDSPPEAFAAMTNAEFADAVAKTDPEGLAEGWEAISHRLKESLDEIVAAAQADGHGTVLVVSHGWSIAAVVELLAPDDWETELWDAISNGSITTLEYRDGAYHLVGVEEPAA
ncbi:histidine phosphatase family protein [Microbacterium gorillae]|uniref:histidine phosphatase family protein n=1 Tax=Microbacterium gorillae TaxID=1231063 RepID=UPI0018A81FFF|nr:histidine phosphatase family protein [Microbacterium gorillae]